MKSSASLFERTATQAESMPEEKKPGERVAVPLSVSDLTQKIRVHLETQFESVWVVGQISNLTYHRSGHVYLTLKDEGAQLSAVIWKTSVSKMKFRLKDGLEIVCRGRLNVYPLH